MPTSFPEIEPTDRSFNAPRWPTSSDTTKSGAITRRLWGSRPNSGQLSLKFQNTTDANAAAILAAYDNAKGPVDTLTLPDILFNGANANLKAWLDGSAHGAGLLWCFTEGSPPQVESIAPGRSTVTVNLTAELRTPSSPAPPANGVGVWYSTHIATELGNTYPRYNVIEIPEPYVNGNGQLVEYKVITTPQQTESSIMTVEPPIGGEPVFFTAVDRSATAIPGLDYWDCDPNRQAAGAFSAMYVQQFVGGQDTSTRRRLPFSTSLTIDCIYQTAQETNTLTYIGPGVIRDWYSSSILSGGFWSIGDASGYLKTSPIPAPDLPGPS